MKRRFINLVCVFVPFRERQENGMYLLHFLSTQTHKHILVYMCVRSCVRVCLLEMTRYLPIVEHPNLYMHIRVRDEVYN